jgi:hypothetical protein
MVNKVNRVFACSNHIEMRWLLSIFPTFSQTSSERVTISRLFDYFPKMFSSRRTSSYTLSKKKTSEIFLFYLLETQIASCCCCRAIKCVCREAHRYYSYVMPRFNPLFDVIPSIHIAYMYVALDILGEKKNEHLGS